MRQIIGFSLSLILLSGCGNGSDNAQRRQSASLDELAVTIRDRPRNYFFSDKRGGFLIGGAGQASETRQEWSVNGQTILHDVGTLTIDGSALDQHAIDSVRVTPLEVVRFFHNGIVTTTAPLDQVPGLEQAHALIVQVQASLPHDIMLAIQPVREFVAAPPHVTESILFKNGMSGSLACFAGDQGEISSNGIRVKEASTVLFIVVYSPGDSADYLAQRTHGAVEELRFSRRDRMERVLQRGFLRTSDHDLTMALRWLQVSLDGLMVESSETIGVAALPWDGSFNVRDNAIAIAGLDVATGNYRSASGLLRSIARRHGTWSPANADENAWFVREMYEHVIASGDTAVVRDLYPTVQAGIAKTVEQHTDSYNLFLQRDASPPGSRAADMQALWYFQQTIGSIFASFLGDTVHAAQWGMQADLTSSAFNRMFIDTSRSVVYAQVALNGRGALEVRPNTLLCLDVIESEAVRQNTVKSIMKALLRPDGIATSAMPEGSASRGGAVQNWMAGQMVYALTRYDCQDISYPVTQRLAGRILTTDMVGVLPEMYEASTPGNGESHALGAQASPAAMAEFIRSFYQDYLGVHINMTTRSLALEPKLPDEIKEADFTIFAGSHPVSARYERTPERDRVVLKGDGLEDSLRVTFLWMMSNGDAWRGAMAVPPGMTTTIVFGERDAVAFYEGKETPLENIRHLKGFSQRKEMTRENGEW